MIAESRSNSLIVRAANPARLNLVRSLVDKLDQPASQSASRQHLRRLPEERRGRQAGHHLARGAWPHDHRAQAPPAARRRRLAQQPQPAAQRRLRGAGASPATTPTQPSAQPSTGGQIQADPATNSLIITAAEPQYRQLRAVIDRLDARRAQVYVESLIAEVNADKAAEFGIQWQGPIGQQGRQERSACSAPTSPSAAQNIITLATQAESGNARPVVGAELRRGDPTSTASTCWASWLASSRPNGDGNILSTPNLLTLDNEEAKIVIGQNVPFVTGQFTNTGASNGSVNPFQTIERKDVGLTLRVKPQISENGTVRMQIFQEASSMQPASLDSAHRPHHQQALDRVERAGRRRRHRRAGRPAAGRVLRATRRRCRCSATCRSWATCSGPKRAAARRPT